VSTQSIWDIPSASNLHLGVEVWLYWATASFDTAMRILATRVCRRRRVDSATLYTRKGTQDVAISVLEIWFV